MLSLKTRANEDHRREKMGRTVDLQDHRQRRLEQLTAVPRSLMSAILQARKHEQMMYKARNCQFQSRKMTSPMKSWLSLLAKEDGNEHTHRISTPVPIPQHPREAQQRHLTQASQHHHSRTQSSKSSFRPR